MKRHARILGSLYMSVAVSLAAVFLLTACAPAVNPVLPAWSFASAAKPLDASVQLRTGVTDILSVKVAFSRNVDVLASGGGRVATAAEVPGSPGLFRFDAATLGLTFADSQAVFVQWIVEYHVWYAGNRVTMTTPSQMFRVGCPGGATAFNAALLADQAAVVGAFNVPRPDLMPGLFPTHRDTNVFPPRSIDIQFGGMGVAFANAASGAVGPGGLATLPPVAGRPALLLYSRNEATAPLTGFTYTLIGWAYVAPFSPSAQANMPCLVPFEAWFVHEAGFHQSTPGGPTDGMFSATPPPGETICGTLAVAPPAAPSALWHNRAWDIHIWRSFDGSPPTVGIFNPAGTPAGAAIAAGGCGAFFTLPPNHPLRAP